MKIALITCSIGGIDEVKKPCEQNTKYDYYCYDETNLPFPLPNLNDRLKAKYIKTQMHRFLPHYDVFIYVDGRVEIIKETFIEEFVAKLQGKDIVLVDHQERKSVFEELNYILEHIKKGNHYLCSRYEDQQMEKELAFYEENEKDLENVTLYGGGFFARWNSKEVNEAMDEWWRRTIEFSCFDQAMLAYVVGKYNLEKFVFDRFDVLGNLLHLGKHYMEYINLSYENVYTTIKDHLRRKAPLAVIRYGDGEAMLLDDDLAASNDYKKHVFKRQLGKTVSEEQQREIIEHLRKAYNLAHIIGIPTPRHERKEEGYWKKAIPILFNVFEDKNDLPDFCSIDLHYDFMNNEILDKLLMNRETLYYISSHNLDDKLKAKYNIKNVYSFQIAPEMKFSPDYKGDVHYPDQFNKIREWIDKIDCKGELCLVGAGVVGKIYNIWFKERGGVSVDIGSVFDNWAGVLTRGVGRGAGVKDDNKFKL